MQPYESSYACRSESTVQPRSLTADPELDFVLLTCIWEVYRLDVHAGVNQQWGLSNELFVLGDSLVLTVLGQVSFMPVLVLAARLCPEVFADALAFTSTMLSCIQSSISSWMQCICQLPTQLITHLPVDWEAIQMFRISFQ